MKMLSYTLLILLTAARGFSDPETEKSVFAPFVSRLAGEIKDGMVKLTWTDSRDVTGPVYVYRSAGTQAEAAKTVPVEVPYGAQSYLDQVEAAGVWQYRLVASDTQGRRFEIAIPYTNAISVTVPPNAAVPAALPAVATPPPPGDAGGFSSLEAVVRGDAVIVSYAAPENGRTSVLYRSAQPLAGVSDLLDAVIVQAGISASPYVDYPVPGIDYYYAVLFEDDLKTGRVSIVPGRNATTVPVEVPAGKYRIGLPGPRSDIRSMPLPLISIHTAVPGAALNAGLPANRAALSAEAAKAVAFWTAAAAQPRRPEKKPRAFAQDLLAPAGGEEYTLRAIVQGPFAKRDWAAATEEFAKYLSLPRSTASEARARFYLGQAYYFSGQNREALFEFLSVKNQYPEEASEWIQAVLPRLTLNATS